MQRHHAVADATKFTQKGNRIGYSATKKSKVANGYRVARERALSLSADLNAPDRDIKGFTWYNKQAATTAIAKPREIETTVPRQSCVKDIRGRLLRAD